MKKNVNAFAVAIVICCALLFSALIWFKYIDTNQHEMYPKSAIVTEVNGELVTITDFSGRMWQFYDDSEDWLEGDICAVIMDNNGTSETVYDDIIVMTQYCGWVF